MRVRVVADFLRVVLLIYDRLWTVLSKKKYGTDLPSTKKKMNQVSTSSIKLAFISSAFVIKWWLHFSVSFHKKRSFTGFLSEEWVCGKSFFCHCMVFVYHPFLLSKKVNKPFWWGYTYNINAAFCCIDVEIAFFRDLFCNSWLQKSRGNAVHSHFFLALLQFW